jgi:tripartite-type tricarboxylate transporter receptor subunit TctC
MKHIKTYIALLMVIWSGAGCQPGSESKQASYPARSLSLICPWGEGGGTDRLSRFVANALEKKLGQPVIVQNRTGGGGAVGHLFGAQAKPDGYTLTMGTFELSTMHWMKISDLSYQNFLPLAQLNGDPAAILVHKDSPIQSLAELLMAIKGSASNNRLKFSGTSTGGAWDLARAGWLLSAGLPVDSVIWVPTDGSKESILKLLGRHIDVVCCSLPEADVNLKSGDLRALGVMADDRLVDYPDVPTLRELGFSWSAVGWRGLLLPSETPTEIVDTLTAALREMADSSDFKEFMSLNKFATTVRFGDDFRDFLHNQDALWQEPIAKAGL